MPTPTCFDETNAPLLFPLILPVNVLSKLMLGKCLCEETYLNGYFKMEAAFEGEVLGFFYHGMNEPMLDKGHAIPVKYRVGYNSVLTLADDIGEIASGDTCSL